MALREFEVELGPRFFRVAASIDVCEGAIVSIDLDSVREVYDCGPSIGVSMTEDLKTEICADVERQISYGDSLRDIEHEDSEAARDAAVDSQISAWKENR